MTVERTTWLDEAGLREWGRRVGEGAAQAGAPLVLALRGPLGAGKSVLARAVAGGAGVRSAMPSPTYNLVFRYAGAGGLDVWHLDLYRLDDPDDVWELGWEELGDGAQVALIEWPERAEPLLPPDRWDVRLAFPDDGGPDATIRGVVLERRGGAPDIPPPEGP